MSLCQTCSKTVSLSNQNCYSNNLAPMFTISANYLNTNNRSSNSYSLNTSEPNQAISTNNIINNILSSSNSMSIISRIQILSSLTQSANINHSCINNNPAKLSINSRFSVRKASTFTTKATKIYLLELINSSNRSGFTRIVRLLQARSTSLL